MGMRPKALPTHHTILIQDAEGAKLRVFRVEIIGKRKSVAGIEPAVVGMATVFQKTCE